MLRIHLANFGNVAHRDAEELGEVLGDQCAQLAPLRLRVHGATALDRPSDDALWASLDGDVDGPADVGRLVQRRVQRLGFLIDRRAFRTQIRVGRMTEATTADYVQRLLDRLNGYTGPAGPPSTATCCKRGPLRTPREPTRSTCGIGFRWVLRPTPPGSRA